MRRLLPLVTEREAMPLVDRAMIGAALFMAMLLIGVQLARADGVRTTVPGTTTTTSTATIT
jgi:hypothetical protein